MADTIEKDPIAELQAVIDEIAQKVVGLNGLKEKQEEIEAALAAHKEITSKGFPLPTFDAKEGEDIYCGFSLAHQGKQLVQKYDGVGYRMDEATKNEVAKVLLLFVKGGIMLDPFAAREYKDKYRLSAEAKTVVGDGGNVFPVPEILETQILMYAKEKSVLLRDATVVDMTSIKQYWPIETGQSSVAWGNTTSESEPTIDEFELNAEELSAYAAVRNHQLADARSDIVGWLLLNMATACGLEIDRVGFIGRASGGSDPFDGIHSANNTAVKNVTMGAGERFADINDDYISQLIVQLPGLRKAGAQFYMNGAVQHYVRMIKDGVGSPIFMPANIAAGTPATLFGYPVNECVQMPTTDSSGSLSMILGNMKNLFIGRRLDSTALIVDPYGLFTTNRTRFKIYQRWAVGVALQEAFVKLLNGS
jgi:HK97 family phage major capsid protein